jgi:hypothetical protein
MILSRLYAFSLRCFRHSSGWSGIPKASGRREGRFGVLAAVPGEAQDGIPRSGYQCPVIPQRDDSRLRFVDLKPIRPGRIGRYGLPIPCCGVRRSLNNIGLARRTGNSNSDRVGGQARDFCEPRSPPRCINEPLHLHPRESVHRPRGQRTHQRPGPGHVPPAHFPFRSTIRSPSELSSPAW